MRPCTCPLVLLRWPARYSAVARTATWDFSSAIFGVWFFTVKQASAWRSRDLFGFTDMPICFPFSSLLVPVRQTGARPVLATLARYECAIVLLPADPSPAAWTSVPHGTLLRALYRRRERKPGDTVQLRVGGRAETLVLAVCLAGTASTFERLSGAGKLARLALESEPSSLLLSAHGGDGGVMQAALNATLAALQAAAFRFATFKTDAKPHRPLKRIDVSAAGKLTALDLTLATSGGNNLARWLTALPPNTLDAAGYRRLLLEVARRLGLEVKFYGEAQLKRLGAGAFLAVSQGNATRDAGIVYLAYRPGAARPRSG